VRKGTEEKAGNEPAGQARSAPAPVGQATAGRLSLSPWRFMAELRSKPPLLRLGGRSGAFEGNPGMESGRFDFQVMSDIDV
jgi:hypothetical protein